MAILTMMISAGAILALVRFGLVPALDQMGGALRWSPKARGQATGFATSAPELVALVAGGLSGVWEAGLWNIASSNIINVGLMLTAAIVHRQMLDLRHRRFLDEILFAVLAVVVPIVLMQAELDTHWVLVPVLLAFFFFYRVIDKHLSPSGETHAPAVETVGSLPLGLIAGAIALSLITVAGMFLGDATRSVVDDLGIPAAVAGWILGVVTSLPEMVTFFAVYATAKAAGKSEGLEDTQEVLDNLAASNMSNTALIYPLGLTVFLLATGG